MALPQQKFREIVFQILYSIDMGKSGKEEIVPLLAEELKVSKKVIYEAYERVESIVSKLDEIDAKIAKTSTSYDFERIQSVERNILRLGVFELFFDDAIPEKVAIAEAVRLSKKFGTLESLTFVNAILDNLYKHDA